MSVITRKIGNGQYAYLAYREGNKVVNKYLGPVTNPDVVAKLRQLKDMATVPEHFRSLFWDTAIERIKIKRNARYVIERVLEYGDLDAVYWLQRVFPTQRILDVLEQSRQITLKSRNFWEAWFGKTNA
jgi:hypothetical protein